MELEYYGQYSYFKTRGLRSEARQNLQKFIDSFTSITEKEAWTRQFLETEEYKYGYKIRHELYEGVVFPALLSGYHRQDLWSVTWLARTAQNFCQAKHLHEQIDFKLDGELLKECYLLDPNNDDVRRDLQGNLLRWFQYCIHEYPTGILYGCDGATIDECQEILSEIEFVREIDTGKTQEKFLNEVQSKVIEYATRIEKHQSSYRDDK
jgi:hypothetical protein